MIGFNKAYFKRKSLTLQNFVPIMAGNLRFHFLQFICIAMKL